MNGYKANQGQQNRPERRPSDPTSQQAEGPLARAPEPATHTPEQATAAARHDRRPASEGPAQVNVHTLKQKPPLTRGYAVPEVGLELHSRPCKHWAPAETCGIRPDPAPVRPESEAQSVYFVHTPKRPAPSFAAASSPPNRRGAGLLCTRLSITRSPPFKPFMIPSAHHCTTGSAPSDADRGLTEPHETTEPRRRGRWWLPESRGPGASPGLPCSAV